MKKNKINYLFIVLIILLAIVIYLLVLFFKPDVDVDIGPDIDDEDILDFEDGSFEEKTMGCLGKEPTESCVNLFNDDRVYQACKLIGDECYYEVARERFDFDFCRLIMSSEYRTRCENEVPELQEDSIIE